MNKDLEILKYQSLKPISENQDSLREIRKTSKNFAIVEAFLLGVIVGKREERKKKAHRSNEDPFKTYIKSLIDQTKRRRSLRLVCKYLEGARFIK